MDYKASRCGVADASLHHAKWGHIVAPLGVVQRCGPTWRGAKMHLEQSGQRKDPIFFDSSMCI